MNAHAMKYDQMAELVLKEIKPDSLAAELLATAQDDLLAAESKLVESYGLFRRGLRAAAEGGNARAAEYIRRTDWDLT